MSLGDFLSDGAGLFCPSVASHRGLAPPTPYHLRHADALIGFGGGSWADEVEETYGECCYLYAFSLDLLC